MKKQIFSLKRNIYRYSFVLVAVCGVFTGTFFLLKNTVFNVKAIDFDDDYYPSGVIFDEEMEAQKEHYIPESRDYVNRKERGGIGQATETRYNTRDYMTTRIKDQGREGTCWAHSITTSVEYLLLKQYGISVDFSPKIMDYRFVSAEEAYKESGVTNAYFERMDDERTFGGGALLDIDLFVFNDPLALVPEYSFLSVMKQNDNRLVELGLKNSYDELWSKDYMSVTVPRGTGSGRAYNTKQSYAEVNNPDDATYVVTGSKEIRFPYYELSEDPDDSSIKRADVIQDIKNYIKGYGAVKTSISVDDNKVDGSDTIRKCSYVSSSMHVYINKGSNECTMGGHGITLVGWDDELTYQDGEQTKQGAFIVQNSYGDKGKNYYLSYDSIFRAKAYYDVESYYDYMNHYSLVDYLANSETPTNSEHIYSLHTDKEEKLKEFTFTEIMSSKGYDVYIKSAGTNNEYQKVNNNSFTSHLGINKYEFENDVTVNGDFNVKLVKVSGLGINDNYRKWNNLMLISNDIYRLSFKLKGGDGSISGLSCEASDYDCTITIPNTVPTKDGYAFLGWADSTDATSPNYQPGGKIYLTENTTLYAIWAPIYTVTFYMNDNTSTIFTTKTCNPNMTHGSCEVAVPDPQPSRNGYFFLGWAGNADQDHATKTDSTITVNSDKNIYAIWAKIYTLSFDVNGGAGNIQVQTCHPNTTNGNCSVTIPNTRPTRDGYNFLGWADTKTATTATMQPEDPITLTGNKTIYAIWAPIYTVSFNTKGGAESIDAQTCYPNAISGSCNVTIPNVTLSKDGYDFLGWSESDSATEATNYPGQIVPVSGDKTFYAVWKENVTPPEPTPEGTGVINWIQDQTHTKENGQNLIVRVDYNIESFVSLEIDDVLVSDEHYTVTAGSTIVSIDHDFIDTLASGEHTITLNFINDTVVNSTFTLEEASDDPAPTPDPEPTPGTDDEDDVLVPDTGANTNSVDSSSSVTIAIVSVLFGALGLVAYMSKRKSGHYKYD